MSREGAAIPADAAEEPFGNYFVSTYPPYSSWSAEAAPDFVAELGQSPGTAPEGLGLYVHIPFCIQRCRYCYYLAYAGDNDERVDNYLEALVREAEHYAGTAYIAGRPLRFVYFGGGTPSLLTADQLRHLFERLQRLFDWSRVEEVCFECAPASVDRGKLEVLRELGVTRVSLGVQQVDDTVLERSGRVHTVAQVERAYEQIRAVSFDVVNLDLMCGMVGETDESFDASLTRILSWKPESVTVYQLEIPHNTPLYRALLGGRENAPAAWDIKRQRLGRAFERLEAAGYAVRSAYAAVRDPVKHRFVYQEAQYRGADLVGLGVSAFAYLAGVHQQNLAALDTYLAVASQGDLPVGRARVLSAEERLVRELVLQLKLGRASADTFRRRHGVELQERFGSTLSRLQSEGWLRLEHGDVVLTRPGLLRADRVVREFFLPQHRAIRYT